MTTKTEGAQSTSSHQRELLEAALKYAEEGLQVFPVFWANPDREGGCGCGDPDCKHPGKHPITGNGHKDATTDPDQIRRWWAKNPRASVAARPGEYEFVLDVDPRNGGFKSLEKLEADFGPLETRRNRTGSGGLHLWFRSKVQVRARNGLLPGIDIKTEKGYVIMPPSLHLEGQYEVEDDRELALAPDGLVELIGKEGDPGQAGGLTPEQLRSYAAPGETDEERLRWVREAVEAIPNRGEFDDRNQWVRMAHAIRAACGEGLEQDGFEFFEAFSERWEGGGYDAAETQRVWNTLPPSRDPGGYEWLLALARGNGYVMPADHPWRAENEFEALPLREGVGQGNSANQNTPVDELDRLIHSLPSAHRTAVPAILEEIRTLLSGLPPLERKVAEGDACLKLMRRFGSWNAAEKLLRDPTTPGEGPFESNEGRLLLRVGDPRDLNLNLSFLVEGMIPGSSIGEVISDYGCGKTWLMVDLAMSVAFGEPFFGGRTVQTPVLFLAYEGQHGIWGRMAGWLYARGLLAADFALDDLHQLLEGRVIVAAMPPLFDHGDLETGLRDSIREFNAGLVIIDTRNKSLGPEQPEDSNTVAGVVNSVLSRISASTDCTFITTHHTGHRNRDRGRGASAWTQGVDFSFIIVGDADVLKAGGAMTVKALKMRDGERPKPFAYRLKNLPNLTVNGVPWTSAVLESADPQLNPIRPTSLEARVFWHIRDNPGCSSKSIRKHVTGKNRELDAARDLLLILNVIENRGPENHHEYYAIPGLEVTPDGRFDRVSAGAPEDLLGGTDRPASGEERADR